MGVAHYIDAAGRKSGFYEIGIDGYGGIVLYNIRIMRRTAVFTIVVHKVGVERHVDAEGILVIVGNVVGHLEVEAVGHELSVVIVKA